MNVVSATEILTSHKCIIFQHSPPAFQRNWSSITQAFVCLERKIFLVAWQATCALPPPSHFCQQNGLLKHFWGVQTKRSNGPKSGLCGGCSRTSKLSWWSIWTVGCRAVVWDGQCCAASRHFATAVLGIDSESLGFKLVMRHPTVISCTVYNRTPSHCNIMHCL
jgi:hypothetical protein